ncbi:SLIT and NTRK-like protein 4 [Eurytemora carolleeae]|uniref:SLIT and NTRK-like protein 4 n=1 Tax=Eurytemora carolleeae TaxID=1294199 RepID=UPI000C7783AC|nr:SLIT and NTRK-like protein 4 [Eurytemora carolleeae]|eukprot:XP_023333941.1 SLIT and NTRK-like protein 4 [Eurytemora affinis]
MQKLQGNFCILFNILIVFFLAGSLTAQQPNTPSPPEDAIICPYPPASSILPCDCLADPRTFEIYLTCYWDMGENEEENLIKFQQVFDEFDSYDKIYVLEMTCDQCWNFGFDGVLNENTTGRFEITYFTLEHFESTQNISTQQFTSTAFKSSRDSLQYLYFDPYNFITPDQNILTGLKNLTQLKLHGLNAQSSNLPSFSSLENLRFLSLSDGSLQTINSDTFKGLEYLTSLFIDNSQVNSIESGTFLNLTSLTHLSITFNCVEIIKKGTFGNLPSLSILNIGDNKIKEIQGNLDEISANTKVLLHNNYIRQLNESTWRGLTEKILYTPLAQGVIDLENNPLDCGCDVKWIIVELQAAEVFSNARCYNGQDLVEVDPGVLEFFCPDK